MTNQSIKSSYDKVPYPTVPRFQTHPNRMAALAKLFGMEPAPVQHCRVLSLGCADGSNIIPMAYQLPESEFVGLDISPKQIAAGQATVDALGLKNIALKPMDLMDVTPGLGQFDYIIVYGVYSWVPPEVQNKILEICRQNLTPNGVAYISYNVYPGWHMHGMVREMMLYHTRSIEEPYSRVKRARSLLDFFADTMPTLSSNLPTVLEANKLILESMRDLLQDQPDEYLLHDQLETLNEPLYLYQFVERAARYELQYLTDAESSALITNYLPAQFARSLQEMAQTRLDLEQFMDFLYVRAFRQTLLCHQDILLQQDIQPESLTSLFVASSAKPVTEQPNLHSGDEEKFQSSIGTTISTRQPLNKAALRYLAEVWPQPVSFEQLLNRARTQLNPNAAMVYSPANRAQDIETLGAFLLKGYALNLVELHAYAPHFKLEISQYPTASALARIQARNGLHITSQRHEIINLNSDLSAYLLPYLDGQHNQDDLLKVLMNLVSEGTLMVQLDEGGQEVQDALTEVLNQSLQKLARDALIVG